ncbi:winged helix-turn-helix transcriptional regulator [Poseidonibacter ostreae]|jgi:DNA-binding HxlR family transcriptional regulator|uniref:Transcriptional regulator n=1 Tax=Poseidonibacter ostreae TaxID=2654171 RepID=A0A6L4WPB0_9BACT|nr:helix-turn-helix domain-containing protein [Poseidonibacter ostreae]KAB7885481.1 transcriptional regulator [Poseidonibacter ostreae]KAB7886128.1 transcriptional regulator [Poseidonibacter ostreae]KAB7887444.1 transcriptional regulator [Poseidonibacter ostreae]MAC84125.1 transcriptional regulator [Arcobacter sp.]|tara:strand:- start:6950 stop:7342 length:393 start_codon:yes stop_codon:yes gene_type:complete
MYIINDKEYECSVAVTLDIFNDKWKLSIIWNLLAEPKRFKDLHKSISQITQKTLTIKLKELEEKNIINREVFAQVPPKVVYSLTPAGERLRDVFKDMFEWGVSYVKEHGEISQDHVTCEATISKKIGVRK